MDSLNWQRWVDKVDRTGESGNPYDYALLGIIEDNPEMCEIAIEKAQAKVEADRVAGDQYLKSGPTFAAVFATAAWCDPPELQVREWVAWGARHLGNPDGSIKESIWWKRRWSRNNPGNNYFHSFIKATSYYVWYTGDPVWEAFLRDDRLPLMRDYYMETPEGGSREGTGYGESHRHLFDMEYLWRQFDGTKIVPQSFIDNSILYWTHATMPGHGWVALIGDHTRAHGRTDGYHLDIIDNALHVAEDPEAIAAGRWQYNNYKSPNTVFYKLLLTDHPNDGHPPSDTVYWAEGAGHFYSRSGWDDGATAIYFTSGIYEEAHQQEDQGAFGVYAQGQWQSSSDSPWTKNGTAQDVSNQNVLMFPERLNIKRSHSTPEWSREGDRMQVHMDLSPAVGKLWKRSAEWRWGGEYLKVVDTADDPESIFNFCKPTAEDERPPGNLSNAQYTTERTATGHSSMVTW